MGIQGRRRRVHDVVIPFGLLFFATFVFFSVWGWLSAGPAQEFRDGTCPATAPVTASCRFEGTGTVAGTLAHYMSGTRYNTVYGVTYTGNGRLPSASVTYYWGPGRSPLPKKGQTVDVTLWQGKPIYLAFGTTTVIVNTPPDKALGAVPRACLDRGLRYLARAARGGGLPTVRSPGNLRSYGPHDPHTPTPG